MTFNIKIHHPPVYEGEVLHYFRANFDQNKQAPRGFPGDIRFASININEQA